MKKMLIAKTKAGEVINFEVEIADNGKLTSQYEVKTVAVPPKKGERYASSVTGILIPVAEARKLMAATIPANMKTVMVCLENVDAWKAIETEAQAIRKAWKQAEIDKAMGAEILGFRCEVGCDAADRYEFIYDFQKNLSIDAQIARQTADADVAKRLAKKVMATQDKTGWKQIPSTLSTYGGWELDNVQIRSLTEEAVDEEIQENAAQFMAAVEAKAKILAIFDTAKTTGQKQVLRSYMAECNDPKEECSQDLVTVYAMPDGTETQERQHTW